MKRDENSVLVSLITKKNYVEKLWRLTKIKITFKGKNSFTK